MPSFFDQWHFHDDAPIKLSDSDGIDAKDTFQRRHMAERLAKLLAQKSVKNADSSDVSYSSFTVAICGPWGTGKTSLRNLTEHFLEKNVAKCPHIAHFNPRQWSNEAAIIQAFFDQLARSVEAEKGIAVTKKKIAENLRNIGNILSYGQKGTEILAVVTAPSPLAPATVPLAAAAVTMGKVADIGERVGGKKAASLVELQDQVRRKMLKLKKPIVVFVDDLDRLTGPEVALVFQLLKFNADFPNVVYVLLADRVILENGLSALYPGEGARYLEKFVQLSIELPKPTTDDLQSEFIKRFEPFIGELKNIAPDLHSSIRSFYKDMLAPYLTTIRRISLYLNAIHFSLPLGQQPGQQKWEVMPLDAMLLELLRLHESKIYQKLKENGEVMTSTYSPLQTVSFEYQMERSNIKNAVGLDDQGRKNRYAELWEKYKPSELSYLEEILAVANFPMPAEKILQQLFPNLTLLFEQSKTPDKIVVGNAHHNPRWNAERRLCSPGRFDRYFSSAVTKTKLQQNERDILASHQGNRIELLHTLIERSKKERTDAVIDELESIANDLKSADVEPFITAIMDWADQLPLRGWLTSSVPPRIVRLYEIVSIALGQSDNLNVALSCFGRASTNTTGFYLPLLCAKPNPPDQDPKSLIEIVMWNHFGSEIRRLIEKGEKPRAC